MRLRTLESRVFLSLVLATTAVFLWMVRGFLLPVFWAAVFAMLFQPVFVRLVALLRGRRSLAAVVATLGVVVAVLVPFGFSPWRWRSRGSRSTSASRRVR